MPHIMFNTSIKTHSVTLTCLCTFVSCSKLFSRKEIFCFWVEKHPLSSISISELCKNNTRQTDVLILKSVLVAQSTWGISHFIVLTRLTRVVRSWTKSFLRLCKLWSSQALVVGLGDGVRVMVIIVTWFHFQAYVLSEILTTVSSSLFMSCLACSWRSLRYLLTEITIPTHSIRLDFTTAIISATISYMEIKLVSIIFRFLSSAPFHGCVIKISVFIYLFITRQQYSLYKKIITLF